MSNICPRCGERPRQPGQGYCRECKAEYLRGYRRDRFGTADEDREYADVELPEITYACRFCGSIRQSHPDRPRYGDFFVSQAEADKCCTHGESRKAPPSMDKKAFNKKYWNTVAHFATDRAEIQRFGNVSTIVHPIPVAGPPPTIRRLRAKQGGSPME